MMMPIRRFMTQVLNKQIVPSSGCSCGSVDKEALPHSVTSRYFNVGEFFSLSEEGDIFLNMNLRWLYYLSSSKQSYTAGAPARI